MTQRTYREQLTHVANELMDLANMCPRGPHLTDCPLCDPWWSMAAYLTVLAKKEEKREVEADGIS